MTRYIFRLLHMVQIALVHVSAAVCRMFVRQAASRSDVWVVGIGEVASLLRHVSDALSPSISVVLNKNRFYDFHYDYQLNPASPSVLHFAKRFVLGPILLGYLANKSNKFFYLGAGGFLLHTVDGRAWEFKYLKARGTRVVCMFVGSEIRSVDLMLEYGRENDRDTLVTYQDAGKTGSVRSGENDRRLLTESADTYADVIFNFQVDQPAHFTSATLPCMYFYPDDLFKRNDEKFNNLDVIRIVHAPSNPLIKATPLVRAAIKKLKVEGYAFEYVELQNMANARVLEELSRSHIALNQFYAFVPGMLGIEAMAHHCAMLCSADRRIEQALPEGANDAWLVTPYWNIYDNLKGLLDNPEQLKPQADRGFEWARKYCRVSQSAERLKAIIEDGHK